MSRISPERIKWKISIYIYIFSRHIGISYCTAILTFIVIPYNKKISIWMIICF